MPVAAVVPSLIAIHKPVVCDYCRSEWNRQLGRKHCPSCGATLDYVKGLQDIADKQKGQE